MCDRALGPSPSNQAQGRCGQEDWKCYVIRDYLTNSRLAWGTKPLSRGGEKAFIPVPMINSIQAEAT